MSENILVIDDEENIRELIKFNLEAEDYKVILASKGKEALKKVNQDIDLIILDLMLPEIDGLTLCKKIRNNTSWEHIPIIMLTAKSEEVDKIIGLEMGADDYITKPFSPRELLARIKAILRRIEVLNKEKSDNTEALNRDKIIKKGSVALDVESHEVEKEGKIIEMTPKEFDLLRYLLINTNKVLTRDLLLEKIWGYQYSGDTRTVDVHIRRLRQKLGEKYIKTVRGVGYKFVEVE